MQTVIAIAIIALAVAYAVYLTVAKLRHPGDCGCGRGSDCPHCHHTCDSHRKHD